MTTEGKRRNPENSPLANRVGKTRRETLLYGKDGESPKETHA
jgi:hypothetical protein